MENRQRRRDGLLNSYNWAYSVPVSFLHDSSENYTNRCACVPLSAWTHLANQSTLQNPRRYQSQIEFDTHRSARANGTTHFRSSRAGRGRSHCVGEYCTETSEKEARCARPGLRRQVNNHHRLLLREILEMTRQHDQAITRLDAEIAKRLCSL